MWQQSKQKDELTLLFSELGKEPNDITSTQIDKLEKYVLDMYDIREDTLTNGRIDRFKMSTDNDIRKLPPCKDALLQYTKRACYQAGFLWREGIYNVQLPDPTSWGWELKSNGLYGPLWVTTLTNQSQMDLFTSTCFCGAQKCKKCKCAKAEIKCISNCKCGRKCANV